MNFRCLLLAMALAVAMTTSKVDGNPHARHARAVAAKAAPAGAAKTAAGAAKTPAGAAKTPAAGVKAAPKGTAAVAGSTPAVTIPKLLPEILKNIKLGTAPKTGVAGLDNFAAAVTTATAIKGKPTAKQLADFGTQAVTSLSTAAQTTKANQAKLQTAVTNGLKMAANQNVEGVMKIIANNAKLLGAPKAVTPVLQKLLPVNTPAVAKVPAPTPAPVVPMSGPAMAQILAGSNINIPGMSNSMDATIRNQLASQFAQGKKPGELDMSSIVNSIKQQSAVPANVIQSLHLPDIQKQMASVGVNPAAFDMSAILKSMG